MANNWLIIDGSGQILHQGSEDEVPEIFQYMTSSFEELKEFYEDEPDVGDIATKIVRYKKAFVSPLRLVEVHSIHQS
ncbi:MAG: hypothetical protein AAF391_07160 [Bacteroidota bacterium]